MGRDYLAVTNTATYHLGDVLERLAEIPDRSIDLSVTSPPFLALRSYLPADHPDKGKEIGSEATPADFLATLCALTQEWRRVLAPHGSLCVELGDTYSGSGGAGGDYAADGLRDGQAKFDGSALRTRRSPVGGGNGARFTVDGKGGPRWPLDKSLCLLPTLYPASLAYGRNLLDPDSEPFPPWRIRNLVVWHRPNPPVGALGDKVRPSTSYITVACTSRTRWFDLDAERGAPSPNTHARTAKGVESLERTGKSADHDGNWNSLPELAETAGAPPLDCWLDTTTDDVWTLSTQPYRGSHYATFPVTLPRKLINLMCPRQVCRECGEPRRRIVGEAEYVSNGKIVEPHVWQSGIADAGAHSNKLDGGVTRTAPTLGWTDCGHNTWRRGVVLDPFAGSGTTLLAAAETGRDSIGIDLDARNVDLCRRRLTESVLVLDERRVGDAFVWTVDPLLPGLKGEHPAQQSLFG